MQVIDVLRQTITWPDDTDHARAGKMRAEGAMLSPSGDAGQREA
jgi:hypothetical protein